MNFKDLNLKELKKYYNFGTGLSIGLALFGLHELITDPRTLAIQILIAAGAIFMMQKFFNEKWGKKK